MREKRSKRLSWWARETEKLSLEEGQAGGRKGGSKKRKGEKEESKEKEGRPEEGERTKSKQVGGYIGGT